MKKQDEGFFINPRADFTIEAFRLEELSNPMFRDYHRYDFHQVLWFTHAQGNNFYHIDFREYTLEANQAVIIYPRQIEKLDIRDKKGYLFAIHNDIYLSISQKINSGYLNGYFSNILVPVSPALSDILEKIAELILLECRGRGRPVLQESYMQSFLFHISSVLQEGGLPVNKDVPLFVKLMELIDSHFTGDRSVAFYAGLLNVPPKKLNEACKTLYGKPPKDIIRERLTLEIKREIRLGGKNLKEIAFRLGFSDQAYFTRFFKRQTGMSPKEFMQAQALLSK